MTTPFPEPTALAAALQAAAERARAHEPLADTDDRTSDHPVVAALARAQRAAATR